MIYAIGIINCISTFRKFAEVLTKEDHIKYWVSTANKDWRAIQNIYKSKDYLPVLFFAHLHIEKLKNNTENTHLARAFRRFTRALKNLAVCDPEFT